MRRMTAIVGGIAMALTAFAPVSSAIAQDPPPPTAPADDAAAGDGKEVAESPTGSYIVVMVADPLVVSIAPADLSTPIAEALSDALTTTHAEVLAEVGVSEEVKVQDYTNALNGFSAVMSHDEAVALAASPKVALVLPDELRQLTADRDDDDDEASGGGTDGLGEFLGLTERGEAWKSGITGEDVVVGVIDSGIWPEHPSFADDGTYGPSPNPPLTPLLDNRGTASPLDDVVTSCDFGNTAHHPADASFACNNKLLGARQMMASYRTFVGAAPDEFNSARDDSGHGSHTASTAAGNANVQAEIFGRDYGKISGIAPRARLIAYKGLGNLGGFTSDLVGAINQAVKDGVDVINYSIGGGAQLVSADTIAFLFAANAGVFVAASAGNSGPGPETIGGPADVPWLTTVGANTQEQFFEGTIRLDRGPTIKGSSVTPSLDAKTPIVDAASVGTSDLCLPNTLDPVKVAGKVVLCKRGGNGRVDKSLSVITAGGVGMILYNATNVDNYFTDNFWVPTVMVDLDDGLKVKGYISRRSNPRAQLITGAKTTFPPAPSMAVFSSRGPNPTAADIIKPDITAPGVQILAGNSPFPDPGTVPGELFQAIAGTSMSSPVVAGVFALIKQARPDWSPASAKSAIMTTADTDVRDNDRVTQAGPFAMGSGMVDPGKVTKRGSAFNPGLVYDAGLPDYLGFLCDTGPEAFADAEATCAGLAGAGFAVDASDLNYPSIAVAELAGSQTVTRTVTSVADRRVNFKVRVNAPAGYDVVVTPDQFTLSPGETATYQVTLTSHSVDTVGQWRTGDLTWKGSGYAVRSPIAVRGTAIAAPARLVGTGSDGTAAIEVKFGYTGAYTAVASGLVPPEPLAGDISQDPDQTFPSAVDGDGADMIPITLTDASYARWELFIEGAADIDLYLLGPTGALVAQSTNGGTDELIELSYPADGTYTLVVHGWSVPGAPLAYSVQNWIVPNAPGSMSVLSQPPSAVVGTTGTVTVVWDPSLLTSGAQYYGAVGHSDGSTILAQTVVSVAG